MYPGLTLFVGRYATTDEAHSSLNERYYYHAPSGNDDAGAGIAVQLWALQHLL